MENRQLLPVVAFVLIVFLAVCTLAGCATTRWTRIEPGEYVVGRGRGEVHEVAARVIQQMEIQRAEGVAVFTLVDGSEIVTSFVPRDRANWPAGCPTNLYTDRMEVLDIAEDTLVIESITLSHPILVRSCPPDPVFVVLREDGDIGGGGGACTGPAECIFFKPERERPWRAGDNTVSTGQDRPVTFDIIASADEEYDRIDAGTFTVTHGPQNGTVVNNLERTGTITEDTGFNSAGTFIIRIVDLVTYTPNAGEAGTDAFTYQICDMDGYCDTATVTVNVSPSSSTGQ